MQKTKITKTKTKTNKLTNKLTKTKIREDTKQLTFYNHARDDTKHFTFYNIYKRKKITKIKTENTIHIKQKTKKQIEHSKLHFLSNKSK